MYVNVHFDALLSFYGKRPVLSQARAFVAPKVFVTLGKIKVTCQNYIIFLTYKTKRFFFRKE